MVDFISVAEVDAAMAEEGFDPARIREFAWELVVQDICNLPNPYSAKVVTLGRGMRRLVGMMIQYEVPLNILADVLDGINHDLTGIHNNLRKDSMACASSDLWLACDETD